MITSIEEMMDALREKEVDRLGRVTLPLSLIESFLRLAYSCGKVDAMIEYRNDLSKDL